MYRLFIVINCPGYVPYSQNPEVSVLKPVNFDRTIHSPIIDKLTFRWEPYEEGLLGIKHPSHLVMEIVKLGFQLNSNWFLEELKKEIEEKLRNPDTLTPIVRKRCQSYLAGADLGTDAQTIVNETLNFIEDSGSWIEKENQALKYLGNIEKRDVIHPVWLYHWWFAYDSVLMGASGFFTLAIQVLESQLPTATWSQLIKTPMDFSPTSDHLSHSELEYERILAHAYKTRAQLATDLLDYSPEGGARDHFTHKYLKSISDWTLLNLYLRSDSDRRHWRLEPPNQELCKIFFEREQVEKKNPVPDPAQGWESEISSRPSIKSQKLKPVFEKFDNVCPPKSRNLWQKIFNDLASFFAGRYDLKELYLIGLEADRLQGRSEDKGRTLKDFSSFVKYIFGNVPLYYILFFLLTLLGWVFYGWAGDNSLTRNLFSLQFLFVYLGIVIFGLHFIFMRRLHLFLQAFPKIISGLIIGYLPLSLAEEAWVIPTAMDWKSIGSSLAVLWLFSTIYLFAEVSGWVRDRSDAMRKASAVSFITLVQAYAIGLLILTFLAKPFTGMVVLDPDSGIRLYETLILRKEMFHCGFLLLSNPIMIPKLLILWMGISMFIGTFVQLIWDKGRLLEQAL